MFYNIFRYQGTTIKWSNFAGSKGNGLGAKSMGHGARGRDWKPEKGDR